MKTFDELRAAFEAVLAQAEREDPDPQVVGAYKTLVDDLTLARPKLAEAIDALETELTRRQALEVEAALHLADAEQFQAEHPDRSLPPSKYAMLTLHAELLEASDDQLNKLKEDLK
jgi:hypothetical protein